MPETEAFWARFGHRGEVRMEHFNLLRSLYFNAQGARLIRTEARDMSGAVISS